MEQIFTSLLLVFLGMILLGSGSVLLENSLSKDTISRILVPSYSINQDAANQSDIIDANGNNDTKLSEKKSNDNDNVLAQKNEKTSQLPPTMGVYGQDNTSNSAILTPLSDQSIKTFNQDGIIRLADRGPP